MKMTKTILTMAAAMAMTIGHAGDSAPFRLDTSTSPVGDSISISWDASWIGGNANATVVIRDNGTEVKRTTGAGTFTYTPSGLGRHDLTYTTLIGGTAQSEVYTASVYGKWKYDVVDDGAVITGTTQTSGSITIPTTIDGYPVTGITDGLFEDCTGLTGVSLPGSLLSDGCSAALSTNGWKLLSKDSDGTEEYQSAAIGNSASTSMSLSLDGPYDLTFSWKVSSESGYDYLRWYLDGTEKSKISGTGGTWQNVPVSVPAGEHTIQWTYSKDSSSASGSDCGWVKVKRPTSGGAMSAIFPDSYATLQSVTLTGATTEIPAHAFEGCAALTSINIPSTVTNIGASAFTDCTSLTSMTIPGSVKQIGAGAFAGCSSLTQVTMPGWFEGALPDDVFEGCPSGMRTEYNIFAVSFNANGGSVGETSRSIVKGNAIGTLPTPTRTGYTFAGWWTAASGGTQISASTTVSGNVTYYAHWTVNQYTVTFNANGGTGGTTKTQDYGTAIVAPTVTRTGYTFTGWSPSVPSTVPAGNTTYTAQWKVNQYTMTFNANGGTGGTTKTQNYGTSLTAPTVARTGYTFTGWSPAVPSTMPAGNTTYTAQWRINQYTVTFEGNGGALGEGALPSVAAEQDYGSAIVAPTATREGYTFTGWQPVVLETVPASNVTYTAQWQVNQYTVTFDANGGTGGTTKTQNYGTSLTAPTVTREGYTFRGWSPSVPATVPAGNVTYTAQWETQYTVTFNANGGTGGWSRKLDRGSAIVAPTATREWFNFTGWSPAVAATVPANNVTYTAQWARWGDTISASKMGGKTMRELYPSDYAHMTTVVIEEGVLELPAGFFDGCDNVVNLTLPESLREFGIDDLPSKIRASLAYDENGFMIYNGWVLDYQNRSVSAVAIPEGIVGIGRGAFAAMFDLETVTMPESLKCIASGAFEDCSWIQDLQFMSGLRHVGPVAFRGCSSLLRAMFADGVENLGTNVFEQCWQMKSVRLPFTVTNIGVRAFSGCSAIRGVTVPTQIKTMRELFPAAYAQIETAEVAEGEKAVMDDMFAGCVALRGGATQTDMSMIPNTVTNIGARAFQGCTSLTAFVVPDSVTAIGEAVFQGCSELWNVTLSRNLSAIPDYAFYGCSMLETMIVPASVIYLGNRFFSGRTDPVEGPVIENALRYLCANAPEYHPNAYSAIAGNMTTYVEQDSRGWDGRAGSRVLPQSWNGYAITYWTPNRFDVTFDANGGRFELADGSAFTWSEQQITDTGYALPSTEPMRPGWAFEGWWTEPTGGAEVRYTTLVTATRTHTLYAHWRLLGNGMTVTFNSNGGTVVVPGSQDYVPGQTFGQFPVPTRRGYDFKGWWTESVNGILMTEATQVPAADMELFAHWSPIVYVVRFHANGGKGADVDQRFVYDERQMLASHMFTRTGFAFSGWATTPSGQVRYAENASVVNLEEVQDKIVDLYAVWSGVGYSVRFDSNGGNGIMDNQTIAVGETQNLWPCAFARGGYNFAGWALSPTDAANGTVKYRDGAAVKNLATENGAIVPLYAVWFSADRTVRITFDANGGSVSPAYWECLVGTAVEAFPTPTRPGFTFAGWWTAKTGGELVESIAAVTGARTFYAHWTENGEVDPGDWSCTVTFDANGGSVSPTTRRLSSGSAVGELPVPVRTGYAFMGWFTAAEDGVEITAATVVASSVTYYAHWEVNHYTVTFNANGGEGEMFDQQMAYGEPTPLSAAAFTKLHSRFAGWATEPDGEVVYLDCQSVQDLTAVAYGVVTLYAVWEDVELTLAECVDASNMALTNDESAVWIADRTTFMVNGVSLRSGTIAAAEEGERTFTTLTATVLGAGTGSFWWKVSCEEMDAEYDEWYDYAVFTIDGVEIAKIAGETDWEQVEFAVTGVGTHTLAWTFTRDDYDDDETAYENAAWVDGVVWTPRPVTVTFADGGAAEGEAPEAVVKYQGYELELPGAGTLANGAYQFVGWSDGTETYEVGATYVFPAANVTLTAVWELKVWTLAEAVDAAALSFTTGGYTDWSVDAANGYTNGVSAKSGAVVNGQSSWIEAAVSGAGTLVFRWNVMGGVYRNNPFAYAKVEVDGVQQAQEHKTEGWKEQTVEVAGAGAHTIRWTYLRTSAREADGDCAWLDAVTWTPDGSAAEGTVVEVNGAAVALETAEDGKTRTAAVAVGTKAEDVKVVVGGVDVTAGFRVAVEGTTATVALKEPFEERRVEDNAPYQDNGDGNVTLNVEVVPGLYYAADSALTIEALRCPGSAAPAKAGDAVVAPKQGGSQGFYKVWVSDAPIMAE